MLNKFFKREYNNTTYLQELLQDEINEKWLENGLLDEMIDINHKDKNSDTFLIKCLKVSKTKSAKWLIDHNADLTLINKDHKTALHFAIEKKNTEIVTQILDKNVINLEQRDMEGRTILQNIVIHGHNEMAKILINHGANINNIDNKNRNLLYDTIAYGDASFLEYILNLKSLDLNLLDEDGNSIMHNIEVIKDDNIARKLLIAGVDPTIKNKKGESYLLNTALRGIKGEELVDIALENGADVNKKTKNDQTILMEIIALSSSLSVDEKNRRESLLRISKKMIQHGGNINAIEKNHESGLFNAIRLCDYDLVSFLLSGGINPNIINDDGDTVLNLIIFEGIKELDIILLLLDYGANPTIRNKDGQTIYEILNSIVLHNSGTKLLTNKEIIKKINPKGQYVRLIKEFLDQRDKEESLNYLDSTGEPLFFKPLLYDHFLLFKLYIKSGLQINTRNKANHTIFYEYILKVFEEDKTDDDSLEKFQNNLSYLLSNKIERNYQDSLGWTVLHKIVGTNCNEKLFNILTKIVLFDYSIQDHQGRTVIHNAIWAKKYSIIKKIYAISPQTINIIDNAGILPITYAALLGNQKLVLIFLEMNSNVCGGKELSEKSMKKLMPMLKNLKQLKVGLEDKTIIKKFDILIKQIIRDFKLL
ncbi:MAG: ankyrin repeat domain-containing protein [Arcobacteraceae bacterium]